MPLAPEGQQTSTDHAHAAADAPVDSPIVGSHPMSWKGSMHEEGLVRCAPMGSFLKAYVIIVEQDVALFCLVGAKERAAVARVYGAPAGSGRRWLRRWVREHDCSSAESFEA
jgi:hypothetical protein